MYSKRYLYDPGRITCLDLLREGFVTSFEEVLLLMEKNERDQTPTTARLRNDIQTLTRIAKHLKISEEINRRRWRVQDIKTEGRDTESAKDDFVNRMELANNFLKDGGYYWLAEYFYKSCLKLVKDGNDEKAKQLRAKAHEMLGLLEEQRGCMSSARIYFDKAISEDANPSVREKLIRMYQKQGCESLAKETRNNYSKDAKSVQYLKKALALSKAGGFLRSEAVSHGLLGNALMEYNKNTKALKHFQLCMTLNEKIEEWIDVCDAHFALHRIYWKMGDLMKCYDELKICKHIAELNGFHIRSIVVSIAFGELETIRRNYNAGHQNFISALRKIKTPNPYKIVDNHPQKKQLAKLMRILYGMSTGHLSFAALTSAIYEDKTSSILHWRKYGGHFEEQKCEDDRESVSDFDQADEMR